MRVGITGHQRRPGIDWNWVEVTLRTEMQKLSNVRLALSSLATGADQIFAKTAISLGIQVIAVIPVRSYERFFEGEDRVEFERLLQRCQVLNLGWQGDDQEGFFSAGKFIVERSDLLFAVWDEQRSQGLGGTADVVGYATHLPKKVIRINPFTQIVVELAGEKDE